MLTGEPLIDLDYLRSSTAEFGRMLKACIGEERGLIDEARYSPRYSPRCASRDDASVSVRGLAQAADKIKSSAYIAKRIELARRRAPPEACDLLERMLTQDPNQRITAAQVRVALRSIARARRARCRHEPARADACVTRW